MPNTNTCIVADCPEQERCLCLRCGTPCKDPEHRLEWIAAWAESRCGAIVPMSVGMRHVCTPTRIARPR